MFNRELPETVNPDLLSTAMGQWQDFWMFPAILAGIVLVAFAALFWDKMSIDSEEGKGTAES